MTKNVAPNSVSGRVVKTGMSRSSSSTRKRISAPSERPIQFVWIFFVRSGQSIVWQVVEQLVGVRRDLEEPLRHVPRLDDGAAAPALPVDDVLVREHGLVVRAPVDRRLLAIDQAFLQELQEQPLRPAVVGRLVRRHLALPVDRPAHAPHLTRDRGDVALGDLERVAALADRRVLGGQPERVEAHRAQHLVAAAAPEMRDDVAHRVVEDVPHVQLPGRVREHLELVEARALVPGRGVVDVEGLLVLPHLLPLGLDCVCVVSVHVHRP